MIHESVTFVGLRYGLWFWWQDCTAVIQVLPIDLFPTTILRYYVTPSLIGRAHTQNDPCAFHDHGWFTAMVPFCIIAWSLGYMPQLSKHGSSWWPGPWFNVKMPSYQYKKSHCGDKTVVRSSYLHNGISYTGKMRCHIYIESGPWSLFGTRASATTMLSYTGQYQISHRHGYHFQPPKLDFISVLVNSRSFCTNDLL